MADKLTDKQIEELKAAFSLYDHESGSVEIRELGNLLRAIGQNPRSDEIRTIMGQLDTNETGSIDFPEFLAYVARKQKEATDDPVKLWEDSSVGNQNEELMDAMAVFDRTGSGFLDKEIVEDLILNQGEGLSKKETQEFLQSIKYNDEGKISYDDFMRIVYNESDNN